MSTISNEFVHDLCKREGFAASGIAPVKPSKYEKEYSSHLYSESDKSAINIKEVYPKYSNETKLVDGRDISSFLFPLKYITFTTFK